MRALAMLTLFAVAAVPAVGRATVLITPQEARQPEATGGASGRTAPSLGTDRGTPTRPPDIEVVSPRAAVASPFPLRVIFTPHNGARIDPNSVAVTLLTSPETDLSDRVRQSITPLGINMPNAEAPPGRFRIKIELTDSAGHIGTSTIDLTVVPY
jgi:hypothetical protein